MSKINIIEFDTIILDLDFTIWKGCEEKYWAKNLISPYKLSNKKIIGSDLKYIEFDKDIKFFLKKLYKLNKKIGFLTLGGLLSVKDEDQPVTSCLKMYDVYKYFNHQKTILYKTDCKAKHIIKNNKTVFIDDNIDNLEIVSKNHSDITCINRYSFNNWKELL